MVSDATKGVPSHPSSNAQGRQRTQLAPTRPAKVRAPEGTRGSPGPGSRTGCGLTASRCFHSLVQIRSRPNTSLFVLEIKRSCLAVKDARPARPRPEPARPTAQGGVGPTGGPAPVALHQAPRHRILLRGRAGGTVLALPQGQPGRPHDHRITEGEPGLVLPANLSQPGPLSSHPAPLQSSAAKGDPFPQNLSSP